MDLGSAPHSLGAGAFLASGRGPRQTLARIARPSLRDPRNNTIIRKGIGVLAVCLPAGQGAFEVAHRGELERSVRRFRLDRAVRENHVVGAA